MDSDQKQFDVIVIGGGHAGSEAAAAAARIGANTALVTQRLDTIGVMSCNPAIGGLGKGHLVREIDALDGLMALAADQAGIQFKVLNTRKGAAVRGPRCQADRALYRVAVKSQLDQTRNLTLIEGDIVDIVIEQACAQGVVLADGRYLRCGSVVLTAGTFLRGMIHIGREQIPAGRVGDAPSLALADRLHAMKLRMGRLKTGTPPRLDGRTIAWERLEMQAGDDPPVPFSALTQSIRTPQISCGITRTSLAGHEIIRENLHLSPVYAGMIEGRGPRYCPSIEDKVTRFGDRNGHQVFLEPEGLEESTVYPNGISMALPADVQERFVRTIEGLEQVRIVRPGYAIEYDFIDPRELAPSLALKSVPNLFLAGQINGTTGYEEAAGQGIVAGINAARCAGGSEPMIFGREVSYIGVMIDDLVTQGVTEPYRLFTSRSEYRLSLRVDNADERLGPIGAAVGCVGSRRQRLRAEGMAALASARELIGGLSATPNEVAKAGLAINADGQRRSAFSLLSRPEIEFNDLLRVFPVLGAVPEALRDRLRNDAVYSVYVDRQAQELLALKAEEDRRIDDDLDYLAVPGLSNELREKLELIRPRSIAQARRVEGMTPACLAVIANQSRRLRDNAARRG